MPSYTYECGQCFKTFGAVQRITDTPLTTCEHCAGPVHRIIYAPCVLFNGEGWTPPSHGGA